MKYAIFIIALALTACSAQQEPIQPTRDDISFSVTLNVIPASKITEKCKSLGVPYAANGCNSFNSVTKQCIIFVAPVRSVQDTERLAIAGHELWHCRYGEYHK